MSAFSRRDFGRVVAGAPLMALAGSLRVGAAGSVGLGVTTSSFRDLPRVTSRDNIDDLIRALKAIEVTHIDLSLANVEPAPPPTAPFLGGSAAYPRRVVLSPEEIARTNAAYRGELRAWRLHTAPRFFDEVRAKFAGAGITVSACSLAYDASFTDDEIDATFRQVKALGVSIVSAPLTMAAASRLVPFAERHQVSVAIHNQMDGNAERVIATPDLAAALALSPAFRLKLDAGNVTASNGDAVAVLRAHQARVSHVVVKDRLRSGGASQPFGEGDTPIAAIMGVLDTSATPIPALVEYDYVGLRSTADELAASLAYLKNALQ